VELLVKAVDTIGEHTNELAVEPTQSNRLGPRIVEPWCDALKKCAKN
jgi:hypothetical protein